MRRSRRHANAEGAPIDAKVSDDLSVSEPAVQVGALSRLPGARSGVLLPFRAERQEGERGADHSFNS